MEDYKCDVIVVTWNQKEQTRSFIDSFLKSTAINCRIIIVDNASSDGSVDYILSLKDTPNCQFKVLLNKENKGFIKGINQGLEVSDAAYVCFANNDLVFYPGWLEEIIAVFEKNPSVGVLNPNSNNLGAHPPVNVAVSTYANELREKYKGSFVELPFCIGFCLVIRREVINKIGGFSEEFVPSFFEDTDYSLRSKQAGYLIGLVKASYVWHKEHASFNRIGKKKEEIFERSREVFRKKWGKILRIAWLVFDKDELPGLLMDAVRLSRNGNYVWFFKRGPIRERVEFFKEQGLIEHCGVNFINIGNILNAAWKILIKKKRYDVVITQSKFLRWFFNNFGYNVLSGFDEEAIKNIKYA